MSAGRLRGHPRGHQVMLADEELWSRPDVHRLPLSDRLLVLSPDDGTGRTVNRVARPLCTTVVVAAVASCGSGSPTGGTTGGASGGGDGRSFGVDRVDWPDSIDGARALLAGLPDDLAGEARDDMAFEDEFAEEFASVSYGGGRTSVMASDGDFDGISEDTDAQDTLGAMFGLGYGCDVDTYEGTIERDGIVPGPDPVAADTVAWFACRIDGAEGEEDFTAHAVGWTSTTDIAWLVVGDDELSVRAMVGAVREAAR